MFYSWHALALYLSINFYLGISLPKDRTRGRESNLSLLIILLGIFTSLTFAPIILCVAAMIKRRFIKLSHLFFFSFAIILFFGFQTLQNKSLLGGRLRDQFIDVNGKLQIIPQTITFRLNLWRNSIFPVVRDNFWTGYGFSNEGASEFFRYSESMYFYLLLSGGVFLLLGFLNMLLFSHQQLTFDIKKQSSLDTRNFASALKTLIFWILIISLIHPYLSDTGPAFLFFILLGLHRGNSMKMSG